MITTIPFYVKIYHIAVKQKLTKLIEAIKLQDYYEIFCKALYFHSLLIKFITWFIQANHKNLFLITNILKQIDENSNQIILQNIFDRQLILESLGPYKGEKIEQIFYAFHADDEFKQLTHSSFMNNFHNFHFFLNGNYRVFKFLQGIYEDLDKYDQEMNNYGLQALEDGVSQQIMRMQQCKKEDEHNFVYIYLSNFRGQHTQFCSQKMLEMFFLPKNCSNFLQSLIECQNIYYQDIEFVQDFAFLHLNVLTFRIECPWLKYALMNSFKQILDDKFDSFQENIITQEDYEDLQKKQFFLTQLLHSFNNVTKQWKRYNLDNLVPQQGDLINASIIISYQSIQLNIFNNFLKDLRSLMPKEIGKRNLSRVILYQCYLKLNENVQNQKNFEQINNFYLDYLNTDSLDKRQIYDAYNLLNLKLLRRPIITNLIFIELLVLEYFEGQFSDKQKFLKHLMQVLRIENLKDLIPLFNYLLIDCLQNFISFNFDQQKRIYFKYSNIFKIQSQLESIDLAYMKLYLFLFEKDGLLLFDEIFQKFRIPDTIIASQIYYSILLNLITSELEFWNVLQMVEDTINLCSNQLKSTIHYTIINIFNQSSSLSFTEIQKQIQSYQKLYSEYKPYIQKKCILILNQNNFYQIQFMRSLIQHLKNYTQCNSISTFTFIQYIYIN